MRWCKDCQDWKSLPNECIRRGHKIDWAKYIHATHWERPKYYKHPYNKGYGVKVISNNNGTFRINIPSTMAKKLKLKEGDIIILKVDE